MPQGQHHPAILSPQTEVLEPGLLDGQALPMWELLSECRLLGECSWVHTGTCAHISTHMHTSPRTHWERSTQKKGPSRLGFPEKLTGNATILESNKKNPIFVHNRPTLSLPTSAFSAFAR